MPLFRDRASAGGGGLFGGLNPLGYMGLGLLSQGPSLTPINPWQGMAQGLGMYGAARQAASMDEYSDGSMVEMHLVARWVVMMVEKNLVSLSVASMDGLLAVSDVLVYSYWKVD